jgi:endonuclease III-like uncharacterized protein
VSVALSVRRPTRITRVYFHNTAIMSRTLKEEREGLILPAGFFMLKRTARVIKSIVQHSRDTQAFNKEHFYRQELN